MQAENDLFSVWGSVDFIFVWVVNIDFFFFARRKSPGLNESIEIDSVFVRVVEVDLISMWEMEPDLISVKG